MFSNLIESGSHANDLKRKGRFFLATTAFYGLLFALTGVGSIYAYNAKLDYDPDYELISIMRFPPAEVRSAEPRREERRQAASPARTDQVAMRTELSMQTPYHNDRIADIHTPEVPQNQRVVIGPNNFTPETSGGIVGPPSNGSFQGTGNPGGPSVDETVGQPPPPPATNPTPAPTPVQRPNGPIRVPSSLLVGKTINKPAPPYPPIAKAARQQGAVVVQIVIDEQGQVISAKATSGPPLLLNAAVQASYRASFTPTVLGGKPVKVTGSITYNFVLN